MAFIVTNEGLKDGRELQDAISELVNMRRSSFGPRFKIFAIRDGIVQMRDGADNAQDTLNYELVKARFGTVDTEHARQLFLEVDSVCGRLVNPQATFTEIASAIDQLEAET